jgi:hypothetical protein
MPLDDMRSQHRHCLNADLALEGDGVGNAKRRRRCCFGQRAQHHDFDGAIDRLADLAHEEVGAAGQRNRAHAFVLEYFLERGSHHAAIPWTPVERDDFTARPTLCFALAELVEHFVGDSIINLPRSAEPPC